MVGRVVLASQGPVPGPKIRTCSNRRPLIGVRERSCRFHHNKRHTRSSTTTPIDTLFPPGLYLTEHLAAEIAVFPNPRVLIRMNHHTGTKGP